MVTWTRWCEYVWLVVASKQIKTGWKFLCFRTTCWTRSTMTHRHRFCQRNAEITTSLNQQCARKRMLRAAVISIHQPPRALHPLTASYIKIEMTSKDSIKIKKYKRRYMCKTCGCIQNTFWSPHKKTPFRKQNLSNSTKHDLKFTTREWSGHSTKCTNKKQKIIIKSGSCRPAQVLTLSLIHVVSPRQKSLNISSVRPALLKCSCFHIALHWYCKWVPIRPQVQAPTIVVRAGKTAKRQQKQN